jgi:predicted ArsR family transcriptional regulator
MKTQPIRETGQQIMAWIAAHGQQTCRQLGGKLGIPKSTIHRHGQAREPE